MIILATAEAAPAAPIQLLTGKVESNGTGLRNYKVSLYAALLRNQGSASGQQLLGFDTTSGTGHFQILYRSPATNRGNRSRCS
jgi:hypothetical protein